MTRCLEIFGAEGTPREVAANLPLALDDPSSVWLVETGRVNVFVATSSIESSDPRIFLGGFESGDLLIGGVDAVDDQRGLIAIGLPGTRVIRLPLSRLQEMSADEDLGREISDLLNRWVERLTEGARRGPMPRNTSLLEAVRETALKPNTSISPRHTLWITGCRSGCLFLGRVELLAEDTDVAFPLAVTGWLDVSVTTVVRGLETGSLLDDVRLWNGLQRFHDLITTCAAANAADAAREELRRMERKAEAEARLTSRSLLQLASSVMGEQAPIAVPPGQDPLLAAFSLVGEQLGFMVRPPQNYGEKKLNDPISAIARASGIRFRRVVLSGTWWKEDAGPLLGTLSEGDRPVALLPRGSGYDIVDPQAGSRTAVTAANRTLLRGAACCFYRSLDFRPLGPLDVVRFSLFGTRRDWIMLIALGLGGAILGLFIPIATGWLFGLVIPSSDREQLWLLVASLAVNALVVTIFEFTQGISVLRLETRMDSSVEAGVWDRLLNLPASFFRQYSTGDLAMRAMGIAHIRQVVTQAAMSSLLTFVFSLVAFVLLFYYDPRLALVATGMFLMIVAATSIATWLQLPLERKQYEVRGVVASLVLQMLTGISRLRVAGAENRALAWWAGYYGQQVKLSYQSQSVSNALATFLTGIPLLSSVAIFAAVALVPSGDLSLSVFLAFSAAFAQIMSAATSVSSTVSSILDIVPLYERSRPILETSPEAFTAKGDPGQLSGGIEISHVSFRYREDGPLALDDVSIEIQPGEFVAFVGPSGAGKSTILRLLLGFESPQTGSIYFDQDDLSQLDRQAVRRQIGVVFQNSRLTSGDIFRNIIGSAPLSLEDAWEAARLSGLDEDIDQMPMGMHTVISEGESTLSGGQRQRLLIARATVNKPKILLFDEATSALDNVTQAKVSRSLESLKATRIVVAHRLSTIMNADRIYVIQAGKVVQQGQYADLMREPGLFAELARRQLV